MIKIEQITVTKENMVDVMSDKDNYVVRTSIFDKSKFAMEPIAKCEIGDLLTPGKAAVIKVTKVES